MIKQAPVPVRIPADCHHPGYHSVSSKSWWCDECLLQFSRFDNGRLEDDPQAPESFLGIFFAEWHLFWDWFKPAAMVAVGGFLSLLFVVVSYFLQHPLSDDDLLTTKENQYKWLTVRRERLLTAIDQEKANLAKAYFDNRPPYPPQILDRIARLQDDLEVTTGKLKSMEKQSWELEQKNIGTRDENFSLQPGADIARSYNASLYWGTGQASEQA